MQELMITKLENIINIGNQSDYISLRQKFAESLFIKPEPPVRMVYYWSLPKDFLKQRLLSKDAFSNELTLTASFAACDVFKESIDDMISKFDSHAESMGRTFICPYFKDENMKEMIVKALYTLYEESFLPLSRIFSRHYRNTSTTNNTLVE